MGSFKQMNDNYRWGKQRRAMQFYAHFIGLSPEAAAKKWCSNGCAKFWNEVN